MFILHDIFMIFNFSIISNYRHISNKNLHRLFSNKTIKMNINKEERMNNILEFWFPSNASDQDLYKLWYQKSNNFDQQIRENFALDWQLACNDDYKEWENTPKGCLTLVVLLDQFSRNMFRNNSGSFSSDLKACTISLLAIEKGFDNELKEMEKQILYMPLMHSEDIDIHDKYSLPKFNESKYAIMHADIIRRFGRYPHRNMILNRTSSEEELEFLSQPNSSF